MSETGGVFEARVKMILRRGRQRGFLTVSELMADLDELGGDQAEEDRRWDELMNRLAGEGIRVVEEVEDVGARRDRRSPRRRRAWAIPSTCTSKRLDVMPSSSPNKRWSWPCKSKVAPGRGRSWEAGGFRPRSAET